MSWTGTVEDTRRARIMFFADNAGYSTPPGRMVCAKGLADAEEWIEEEADDQSVEYAWEYEGIHTKDGDELGDHAYWCHAAKQGRCIGHEVYSVVLWIGGKPCASLGGIIEPTSACRRVIEAELAQEAHDIEVTHSAAM